MTTATLTEIDTATHIETLVATSTRIELWLGGKLDAIITDALEDNPQAAARIETFRPDPKHQDSSHRITTLTHFGQVLEVMITASGDPTADWSAEIAIFRRPTDKPDASPVELLGLDAYNIPANLTEVLTEYVETFLSQSAQ